MCNEGRGYAGYMLQRVLFKHNSSAIRDSQSLNRRELVALSWLDEVTIVSFICLSLFSQPECVVLRC